MRLRVAPEQIARAGQPGGGRQVEEWDREPGERRDSGRAVDPERMNEWSEDQWDRAEASGFLDRLPPDEEDEEDERDRMKAGKSKEAFGEDLDPRPSSRKGAKEEGVGEGSDIVLDGFFPGG